MCACPMTSKPRRERSMPRASRCSSAPALHGAAEVSDAHAQLDVRDLTAGQIVDGFRLEAPLKPGGMANLWRVTRAGDALPMVMKIPLVQGSPVNIVGFEVEGMILPRLSGPHVPRFIAAGDFSRPYVVMEFITGQSLKARLADAPLPPGEVVEIGVKIALALHDLHRQHVIH